MEQGDIIIFPKPNTSLQRHDKENDDEIISFLKFFILSAPSKIIVSHLIRQSCALYLLATSYVVKHILNLSSNTAAFVEGIAGVDEAVKMTDFNPGQNRFKCISHRCIAYDGTTIRCAPKIELGQKQDCLSIQQQFPEFRHLLGHLK